MASETRVYDITIDGDPAAPMERVVVEAWRLAPGYRVAEYPPPAVLERALVDMLGEDWRRALIEPAGYSSYPAGPDSDGRWRAKCTMGGLHVILAVLRRRDIEDVEEWT